MGANQTDIYEELSEEEQRIYYASHWQLMWWQFKKHRLALLSLGILAVLYFAAVFADLVTPYDVMQRYPGYENMPPTKIHFMDNGKLQRPYIYKLRKKLDPETVRMVFTEDTSEKFPILFFFSGEEPRKLFGVIPINWRPFGTGPDGPPVFLFGSDRFGRDIFSRTIYGGRVSLFIGFGGVIITFVLGCTLGGLAGYFGDVTDEVIMRLVDFLVAIPKIPLWMALAAAVPRTWPVTKTYFAITIILSIVGWGGLARTVRGKLLSLREEDYVMAAEIYNASVSRLIFRYMLPNFMSYLLVNITLSIPSMILGETSLSFLGLGIQPPAVSWGALLRDAQQLVVVVDRPWQMVPGAFVVIAVLMFNFVGDGLRDAADPYSRL